MRVPVDIKETAQRHLRSRIPPRPPAKAGSALRFGVLGTSRVASRVLIDPARLHAEVIVDAVAAEDHTRATQFAREHGIARVFGSYDELINDPNVDAVYIGVASNKHLELAQKVLARRKHVLLGTPSVCTEAYAGHLFHSSSLLQANRPVLLEAIPYRFHPSWIAFQSHIDRDNIKDVKVTVTMPVSPNTPRNLPFRAEQSGAAMMGPVYALSILQGIFRCDASECEEWNHGVDEYSGRFKFELNNRRAATGVVRGLKVKGGEKYTVVEVVVMHERIEETPQDPEERWKRYQTRTVRLHCSWGRPALIRIAVEDVHAMYDVETEDADETLIGDMLAPYTLRDAGVDRDSKPYWKTPKYMLDEFVHRVKGRPGSGAWITAADSMGLTRLIE
ncbi:hypothetical protein C8A03DRAFT_11989, partial [Achaetomium macrosporum]